MVVKSIGYADGCQSMALRSAVELTGDESAKPKNTGKFGGRKLSRGASFQECWRCAPVSK